MRDEKLKIGVFDSGLGGLTIVKAMTQVIQNAEIIYIADTLHAPYGEKSVSDILNYSLDIADYLVTQHHIDALVVACNTATSAAIKTLRSRYPDLIIIGTEPAIKPAIEQTKTGNIGVLATPATLKGDKYQALVDRVVSHDTITLYEQPCPGLVEAIEHDMLQSEETIAALKKWLTPMLEAEVDTIVLGCTHYPLASLVIQHIMQNRVTLIDSGGAIAQHLLQQLSALDHVNKGNLLIHLYYTGTIRTSLVHQLLNHHIQKLTHVKI